MRFINSGLAFMAGIVAAVVATSFAGDEPDAAAEQPPLALREVQERGIMGLLGVRLGTIVEVRGTVIANTSRLKADEGVPYFLSIYSVNGVALPQAITRRFEKANIWVKVEPPKIGDEFRYAGFETGRFTGSPAGEFDYVNEYTTTNYHFETSFQVLGAK